jgi:hypothetical protein
MDESTEPAGTGPANEIITSSSRKLRVTQISLSMSDANFNIMYSRDDATPAFVYPDLLEIPLVICCFCGGVISLASILAQGLDAITSRLRDHMRGKHPDKSTIRPDLSQIGNAILESNPQF